MNARLNIPKDYYVVLNGTTRLNLLPGDYLDLKKEINENLKEVEMTSAQQVLLKALSNLDASEAQVKSQLQLAVDQVAGYQLELKRVQEARKEIQEALSKLEGKDEPIVNKGKKIKK